MFSYADTRDVQAGYTCVVANSDTQLTAYYSGNVTRTYRRFGQKWIQTAQGTGSTTTSTYCLPSPLQLPNPDGWVSSFFMIAALSLFLCYVMMAIFQIRLKKFYRKNDVKEADS